MTTNYSKQLEAAKHRLEEAETNVAYARDMVVKALDCNVPEGLRQSMQEAEKAADAANTRVMYAIMNMREAMARESVPC